MKKPITLLLLALLTGVLHTTAQNVSNVAFRQEGQTVVVTYDLDKAAHISLSISTDGGKTFSKPLEKVSGDVGRNVDKGKNRIVWNVLEEQEKVVSGSVVFKVKAEKMEKMVPRGGLYGSGALAFDAIGITGYNVTGAFGVHLTPHFWVGLGIGYMELTADFNKMKPKSGDFESPTFLGDEHQVTSESITLIGEKKEHYKVLPIFVDAKINFRKPEKKWRPFLSIAAGAGLSIAAGATIRDINCDYESLKFGYTCSNKSKTAEFTVFVEATHVSTKGKFVREYERDVHYKYRNNGYNTWHETTHSTLISMDRTHTFLYSIGVAIEFSSKEQWRTPKN